MTAARAVLSLALTCVAGCAGPAPLPLTPPPVEAMRRPALALAPIECAYRATADRPRNLQRMGVRTEHFRCGSCGEDIVGPPPSCTECGGDPLRTTFVLPFRPRTDVEAVLARAATLITMRAVFERVVLLPSDDPRPEGLEPAQLREAWRDTARAKGARFLLEPVLEDARVELLEKNGWYPLKVFNLIVGAIAIVPILDPLDGLIAGEVYGVVQALTWQVVDLASDETMAAGRFERVTRASFNDFGPGPSRGYIFFGTVRTPGCLEEDDWTNIHAQLADVAAEDLAGAIVEAAERGARSRQGTGRW